jgi:hypothetical protein
MHGFINYIYVGTLGWCQLPTAEPCSYIALVRTLLSDSGYLNFHYQVIDLQPGTKDLFDFFSIS